MELLLKDSEKIIIKKKNHSRIRGENSIAVCDAAGRWPKALR